MPVWRDACLEGCLSGGMPGGMPVWRDAYPGGMPRQRHSSLEGSLGGGVATRELMYFGFWGPFPAIWAIFVFLLRFTVPQPLVTLFLPERAPRSL